MGERSKTADQALALLEGVADHGPGSVSELARRLQINRTVAHRLLATLERRGYVRRGAHGYELGHAVLALAGRVAPELRAAVHPALEALAGEFAETAVLSVPDGDDAVVVEQVLGGEHMVIVHYLPGFRHDLSLGAHGRALLAFADPALVARLLARCDEQTARRLEETRARGYAISQDELLLGASGLAAPVRDGGGTVVASIGVVAPVHRFLDPERLATSVLGEAEAITTRLGAAHGRSRPRQGRGQQGGDDGVLPQGG